MKMDKSIEAIESFFHCIHAGTVSNEWFAETLVCSNISSEICTVNDMIKKLTTYSENITIKKIRIYNQIENTVGDYYAGAYFSVLIGFLYNDRLHYYTYGGRICVSARNGRQSIDKMAINMDWEAGNNAILSELDRISPYSAITQQDWEALYRNSGSSIVTELIWALDMKDVNYVSQIASDDFVYEYTDYAMQTNQYAGSGQVAAHWAEEEHAEHCFVSIETVEDNDSIVYCGLRAQPNRLGTKWVCEDNVAADVYTGEYKFYHNKQTNKITRVELMDKVSFIHHYAPSFRPQI